MSSSSTAACCKLAPASSSYEPKGRYEKVGDLETYIIGDEKASTAIVYVYDIFGFTPPSLQGADRLAATSKSLVLVPDLLLGAKIDNSLFPPDTDEKMAKIHEFIGTKANPQVNIKRVLKFTGEAKAKFPATSWGSIGFCWGGKLTGVVSGENTPYTATVQAHPSMLDVEDAKKVTIPHLILGSKDEDASVLAQYKPILEAKNGGLEIYGTMHHGWMGARANFDDEENRKEFERGYNQASEFFVKHL